MRDRDREPRVRRVLRAIWNKFRYSDNEIKKLYAYQWVRRANEAERRLILRTIKRARPRLYKDIWAGWYGDEVAMLDLTREEDIRIWITSDNIGFVE